MFAEWLILGSMSFWIVIGIAVLMLVWFIEIEAAGLATALVVAILGVLFFFGNLGVAITWCVANPLLVLAIIAGYFVAGAGWSVVKWYFFVSNKRERLADTKKSFLLKNNESIDKGSNPNLSIPDALKTNWKTLVDRDYDLQKCLVTSLTPYKHKARLYIWIGYWPFSFVWTMINDPVKKAIKAIRRRLTGIYEFIARKIVGNVSDDLD